MRNLLLILILLAGMTQLNAKTMTAIFHDEVTSATGAEYTTPEGSKSFTLKLTATNDDPLYRRSVYFAIDGIGGEIAYGIAPSITDGYMAPKSTKSWIIDLNRAYPIVVRTTSSYSLDESRDEEHNVDYRDILLKPGSHKIRCFVMGQGASSASANPTVTITASDEPVVPIKIQTIKIIADNLSDIRISKSVAKLRSSISISNMSKYQFIIGRDAAKRYIPIESLKGLSKDGFISRLVKSKSGNVIAVSGNDIQGISYGVIRLAHTLLTYPGDDKKLSMRLNPAYPIREMYEERPLCGKDELPVYKARLDRYFDESANIIDTWGVPLPPVEYYTSPEYVYKRPYGDPETFEKAIDYAHSLGIKVYMVDICQMNTFLDVPLDMVRNIDKNQVKDLYATTQSGSKDPTMLCLSNPIGEDIIKRQLKVKCQTTKNLDGFIAYFADPGGCWCKDCRPWGKTIIRHMNDVYAPVIRETNPKLKIILSLWGVEIHDVEYIVNHINELPACVTAIQIPPTSMVSGKYMTYEPRIAPLIKKASKKLPVILQQFYDGVGFKDAWVDIWEHPMPLTMQANLKNCDNPHGTVKGLYGSVFRLGDQLVDFRTMMNWTWTTKIDPHISIADFANEMFGYGTGKPFADAMFSMEQYWLNEARRFHYQTSELSDSDLKVIQSSLKEAISAEKNLRTIENDVKRNKLYFKGFLELAELVRVTAEANISSDKAWKSFEANDKTAALDSIQTAITRSERAVNIISNSDRYAWLMNHPWWKMWSIAQRPSVYRNAEKLFTGSQKWGSININDSSFEEKSWSHGRAGSLEYSSDAKSGNTSAILTVAPDQDYVVISNPDSVNLLPNTRYKVSFDAKVISGKPSMYLDWSSNDSSANRYDGPNSDVSLSSEPGWKHYTVSVNTPDMPLPDLLVLRFVAVGEQKLLIDGISVSGPISE